ncbi:hypothetical protein PTSG_11759 [Salpingoeca rosetta]|uniref:Cysteine-rich transmembrane CYSTM domain-containing protein n=1 Tax=Salpingoeca rosetta (strain ATCC 50818 / BSB-021) TaxID=946362 RepID=F2TYE1_SALR5|nr:uncharacterized protein PTSG_11759 [Salpingoeca rosetta]EGD78615.1 hypothetical protein PTSG_11759 [Salpingoeca rosetta]|eukprot:XP_004997573.1 hypothetical protein PTSG_11759 [Salpingoeca rosetta]
MSGYQRMHNHGHGGHHHHHGHGGHHHHGGHKHHGGGPYVVEETVVYQPRAQETVYVERNPRAEEDLCCGIALASLLCCCLGAATN